MPNEVQGGEPEGHAACPGGRYGERQAAIVGAAVLMFQRGDELLGFTKHVPTSHLQRVVGMKR